MSVRRRYLSASSGSRPHSFTSWRTCRPKPNGSPTSTQSAHASRLSGRSSRLHGIHLDQRDPKTFASSRERTFSHGARSSKIARCPGQARSAFFALRISVRKNAVDFNPVKGAKRPKVESNEGKTPALGDHQARVLLDAPDPATLKGKRDRALLSVLLYHGLRCEELCTLKVRDIHARRGVLHLRVHGKGNKLRYLPLHAGSAKRIHAYLEVAGHSDMPNAPLFLPVRRKNGAALTADGVYKTVLAYAARAQIDVQGFGVHSLRATAATNALEHEADIAKVQEWLGHANIAATRIYDRRKSRPEDSPTFRVIY